MTPNDKDQESNKDQEQEQRQHKRYSIDGCAVQSRESRLLGLFSKTSKKHMVLDISVGGIHFISREVFKKGKEISLTITAPSLKGETIQAQGRVRRVRELPGLSTYGVGVGFISIDQANRDRLKALLKSTSKSDDDISSFIDITASEK